MLVFYRERYLRIHPRVRSTKDRTARMLENPQAKNMQLNEVKSYFTKLNVCRILATNILHNIFHNPNGQWKINLQL